MHSIATPGLWLLFGCSVLGLIAVDFSTLNRKDHAVNLRGALTWSVVWVFVALLFNGLIWMKVGSGPGLQFLTGYLIEKALAVDNLFLFALIFSYAGIPPARQHRVLLYGVLGALVFRGAMIVLGAALLARFAWITYVFGAFLAFTGARLLFKEHQIQPEKNPLFRFLRKVIPVADSDGDQFFIRQGARRFATPLFLALILIEITDVVFAVDSIPAVFSITPDPFIVFTSNVFAILGLRAMYLLLADFLVRLKYLNVGLSLVLMFVGGKMLLAPFYEVSVLASFGIVVFLLAASAVASFAWSGPRQPKRNE